ncbi:MAG: metallophosphoesterase [Vicinamibacterales bacterium]
MRRRTLFATAAGVGAALAAADMVANTYRFTIERIRCRLRKLESGVRIVLLCDLHFGPFIRRRSVAAWVEATLAERPDLVIVGGDLVDGRAGEDVEPLVRELGRLHAPLGTFAAWGNHDYIRFGDPSDFGRRLERVGISVLENRGTLLRDDLFLAAIDDVGEGEPDMAAALAERPAGAACVLVAHNPEALSTVPPEVDLTLCGHTHGGQINVPGIGPLVKASDYTQRLLRGWSRQGGLGYVSRGLGVSSLPLRLNCPPELTVLELMPADG